MSTRSRATKPDPAAVKPAPRKAARPWTGFRGDNASGNGDGQGAVVEWNLETNHNIRWKTPIPGISTSSPVVAGNRVFVVTAISSNGDTTFRTGLYGDVAPVDDLSEHSWKIYALDKASGKILWERTAYTGAPKVKRHTKSSQANSTPVTNGRHVVAVFGSIGMIAAWDVEGRALANEDGQVIVARAGRTYEELVKNEMKEVIMSTPAISDGVIVVRTLGHVYGIGEK